MIEAEDSRSTSLAFGWPLLPCLCMSSWLMDYC